MIHGYRAHVDGEQRCGWRSSAGFTGGRAAAIRATFGTRSLLRTGCRCGSLSTPPRSRTATEPAWSSIKSATASRRRGRAPALGSVRGRSPGRTRTGETRRKRPFGRATRRARFEPLPRSKKDRASETCKTHIASERRQLGVRVRREPRRSSAGGNFPLQPLPTQDPEDNPVRLHLHREASPVQLS